MLSTLGFSIILQNVATNVWGSDPLQLPAEFLGHRFQFGPASELVFHTLHLRNILQDLKPNA